MTVYVITYGSYEILGQGFFDRDKAVEHLHQKGFEEEVYGGICFHDKEWDSVVAHIREIEVE